MEKSLLKNAPDLMRRIVGGTFELRILQKDKFNSVWSCIRDDFDKDWAITRKKLVELNKRANVFFTLNPLKPACRSKLAHGAEFVQVRSGEGVSDSEIEKYRWLLIDLDPDRPKDISSSDEEKALAYQKAQEIKAFLVEKGFFAPVFCDSGNGYHLLFRIDMENSKENSNLLRESLNTLSEKFSDSHVKVDRKVFNAARIVKYYGSTARKGKDDEANGRPHRVSGFICFPDEAENKINPKELIESLVEQKSKKEKGSFSGSQTESIAAVRDFLDEYDIAYREEGKHDGFYFYLEDGCVFNPDHKGKDACVIVNQDGMRIYKCFHDSCEGNHWKDFVKLFDPEYKTFEERKAEDANILQNMFGDEVVDENSGEVKEFSREEKIDLFEKKEKQLTAEIRKIEKARATRKLEKIEISSEEKAQEGALLTKLKLERQEARQGLKTIKEFTGPQVDFGFDLDRDDKGRVKPMVVNFERILEHDSLIKSTYAYNMLTESVFDVKKDTICDEDEEGHLRGYIELKYGIYDPKKFKDSYGHIRRCRTINPLVERLDKLEWDGTPRVETALIDLLGAEDTEYTRFVSKMMFVAAIARAYKHGIKYDNMVVLVGPQGCGKSTFCRRMALEDTFFSDNIKDIESDNTKRLMRGKWIIEWSELTALKRAKDANALKDFISCQIDELVLKFKESRAKYPRKCVFIGTTNDDDGFLIDTTGNRRFFPVEVCKSDPRLASEEESVKLFEQIYAEAILIYKSGFSLVPPKHLEGVIEEKREDNMELDPRVGEIEHWIESQPELDKVCCQQLWYELFDMDRPMTKREANDLAKAVRQVKCVRKGRNSSLRFEKYGVQKAFVIERDDFLV
jgi:hypothetical protein